MPRPVPLNGGTVQQTDPHTILEAHARSRYARGADDIESLFEELVEHSRGLDLDVPEGGLGLIAARVVIEEEAYDMVRLGFCDREEIVDDLAEMAEEALVLVDFELVEGEIERIVDRLWEARHKEQEGGPEATDNDKLEKAFAHLNEAGIVARENFACCQTCSVTEIGGEVPDGVPPDGFVFYHQQDTENAVTDGELWLSYGTFASELAPAEMVEVGERVVAALNTQGLRTKWDGSHTSRITVRLTGSFAFPPLSNTAWV